MAQVTDMKAKRLELKMSLAEFYAIPGDNDSDSHLPIFDEAHVRAAMSRWNQVKGVSAEQKAEGKKKIIAAAHKFKIDTTNFEKEGNSIPISGKEIRSFDNVDCELRAVRRGRTIEGRGIVFNKESKDLGGFNEIIAPESVADILDKSDILALLNHNEERGVLARSTNGEGTLELTVDANGVNYKFDAPDTSLGDEVLSGVRRGDIRTSSFSFSVSKGQKWEKRSDGTYLRTITKFDKIFDVSPVYREAYADTTVAVRNLVEIRSLENTADIEKRIADLEDELRELKSSSDSTNVETIDPESKGTPEVKPEDLTEYYKELKSKIPIK
jgi:uncharacterized protein